jgi:hypothetical protein
MQARPLLAMQALSKRRRTTTSSRCCDQVPTPAEQSVSVPQRRWSTRGRGSCIKPVPVLSTASQYLENRGRKQSHDSEMCRVWHSRRRSSLGALLPRTYPGREQQFRARFAVSSSRKRRHSSSLSPCAVRAHCCLFSILADGGYGLSSRDLILVGGPQPMGRAEWPSRYVLFLGDSPTHAPTLGCLAVKVGVVGVTWTQHGPLSNSR